MPSSLPLSSLNHYYSRRCLLHTYHNKSAAGNQTFNRFDADAIMVVAALMCAVTIGLVLNVIIRYIIRTVKQKWIQPEPEPVSRPVQQVRPSLVHSAKVQYEYCPICLSEVGLGEVACVLPKCGHGFHVGCINQWLEEHVSCPCCRQCSFGEGRMEDGFSEGVGRRVMGPAQVAVGLPPELEDLMDNYRVCC